MFRDYAKRIISGEHLLSDDAYKVAEQLLNNDVDAVEAAVFLIALRTRKESEDEIIGFVNGLKDRSIKLETDFELLDTCGTGGDGLNTFNISTAAALVTASCGVSVAKHGNRAISSACGSADVLEALGVKIDLTPDDSKRLLDKTGITFLFAPYYHPLLKKLAPLRKHIGVPTIFNFLGPLLNPFQLTYQVLGVSDVNLQETMAKALQKLGRKRSMVIHACNGMDEISPTGLTRVYECHGNKLKFYHIDPQKFKINSIQLKDIKGTNAKQNASIIYKLLSGEKGPCLDVVLLNAAASLMIANKAKSMTEAILIAQEAIDSGKALSTLRSVISYSRDQVVIC
ncbi:Anthranilate phosphoribosyltransferase [Candidatus Syntrophocurvum alkaliphilum]|uniref:Anthranilate phosphoribosyltransferase n=1 Tax=Candidatus Syntrophocurvum alkaliphilum TaxID=2293317 RepID=A0A6I6DGW0_9FIRM|nr:anthranilate phosphoribosyltransferase [Candidatus Syntrophocurvum alkaliphilum]QGU00093.1 Anthranilate phosphoribosyltransferase [Candidatus Syntrophocurvum alkaliphilum]